MTFASGEFHSNQKIFIVSPKNTHSKNCFNAGWNHERGNEKCKTFPPGSSRGVTKGVVYGHKNQEVKKCQTFCHSNGGPWPSEEENNGHTLSARPTWTAK